MIEIIKKGKLKHFEATCPNCGTVFRFDGTDIHKDIQAIGDMSEIVTSYVDCPLCGNEISKFKEMNNDCSKSN